jgi:hypothetical protein
MPFVIDEVFEVAHDGVVAALAQIVKEKHTLAAPVAEVKHHSRVTAFTVLNFYWVLLELGVVVFGAHW